VLELPASPHFRLEKEIKNVITVIAKTCHYWVGHMPLEQQQAIGDLFQTLSKESPLVTPDDTDSGATARDDLARRLAETIRQRTGLQCATGAHAGWLGVQCPDVRSAVWMMRALVASNVLSRREESTLFVPVNPSVDPRGEIVAAAVAHVYEQTRSRG
jgi:hypothetical protein